MSERSQNAYLRIRPFRPVDATLPAAAARNDGAMAGTHPPERAAAPMSAAVQDASPAGVRRKAERAAADFSIVDIPRESPGMYDTWPQACVVLVPLAVLVAAMVYLLVRGWPW